MQTRNSKAATIPMLAWVSRPVSGCARCWLHVGCLVELLSTVVADWEGGTPLRRMGMEEKEEKEAEGAVGGGGGGGGQGEGGGGWGAEGKGLSQGALLLIEWLGPHVNHEGRTRLWSTR